MNLQFLFLNLNVAFIAFFKRFSSGISLQITVLYAFSFVCHKSAFVFPIQHRLITIYSTPIFLFSQTQRRRRRRPRLRRISHIWREKKRNRWPGVVSENHHHAAFAEPLCCWEWVDSDAESIVPCCPGYDNRPSHLVGTFRWSLTVESFSKNCSGYAHSAVDYKCGK